MPRTRRFIRAGRPFELEIRVKSGLPFVCTLIVKLLLMSAMARAQRDNKVKIHDHIWQGNHLHLLFTPYDAEQCVFFYQEIQKKITEYMKRLLGVRRLNLWEGDPILAEIKDLQEAMNRLVYFYANPTKANLVDTIDEYPGLSSWQDFLNAPPSVTATVTHRVPWIRLPSVQKLSSRKLSESQDRALYDALVEANPKCHDLVLYPYAWLKCFGVETEEGVQKVKTTIIERLRQEEETYRQLRRKAGKGVKGAEALRRQAIMTPHTPPPRERRVFVLSSIEELRVQHIADMDEFCARCDECYRAEKAGRRHNGWPPGAIRPGLRPVANATADIGEVIIQYTKAA